MVGEGAGLIVVDVEAEPSYEQASFAQPLAPFGRERRFSVSGGGSEEDQAARSRAVKEPYKFRPLYCKLANGRGHGLGKCNTWQLNQNGVTKILRRSHYIHLRALPTHRTGVFIFRC